MLDLICLAAIIAFIIILLPALVKIGILALKVGLIILIALILATLILWLLGIIGELVVRLFG
ncbi:MAG: hypothetical protein QMD21_07060 [Candidatus Thermoplasmatota archaeon]|nr:hypothetical protein [Candidatus Thermoplasmatota archaeon]